MKDAMVTFLKATEKKHILERGGGNAHPFLRGEIIGVRKAYDGWGESLKNFSMVEGHNWVGDTA